MADIRDTIKLIYPLFKKRGYKYQILGSNQVNFSDKMESIKVSFDVLDSRTSNWEITDCEFRVQYAMRFGPFWIIINPKLLITDQVIDTSLFYANHDEMIDVAVHLGKQATNIVLPLIERVAVDAVFPTDDLYYKLSQVSLSLVAEFAQEHELDFQATRKNLDQVKSVLESWIPDKVEEKRVAFEARLEDIIKLAAYMGNTIIRSFGGSWEWETVRRYGCEVVFSHEYYVCYYDNDGDPQEFDSLYHVLMHWNLHNTVQFSGLESSICKECFCSN